MLLGDNYKVNAYFWDWGQKNFDFSELEGIQQLNFLDYRTLQDIMRHSRVLKALHAHPK